jgi:hypothetical protein
MPPKATLATLLALGGYALMIFTNPARASFRDGLRALRRYPALWLIPGAFAFCASAFQLAERAYFAVVLPATERPSFLWMREAWRDPQFWLSGSEQSLWWLPRADLLQILRQSIPPALEMLAGIFNCLVATFPVSALAALLLLINRGGHHGVLIRALQKRMGILGWVVHLGIVVCAIAALAKPLLYLAAPTMAKLPASAVLLWLQWSQVAAWLAFLFEYLCGVFVQIYLILLAFIWVRGLNFTHGHLVDFAMRRFSSVMKWAAVIMLLSTLFIELPLVMRNFGPFAAWLPDPAVLSRRLAIARMALAILSLAAAAMQITLIFHGESLRAAWRDHFAFVRANWWTFGWFVVVAALHCYALHAAVHAVAFGVGEGTALWVLWSLIAPWLGGVVGAWLLASWVCVYKRCATPAQSVATQTLFRF